MRIIIMGCGRVGTSLAAELDGCGHEVVVVDRDVAAFTRLPATFTGRTVAGVGFDRAVLAEAGLEGADAFVAVSSGDNSNIIAARVAREFFGINRVIARIYDPGRAEVYERLGIPTVATVPWATRRFVQYVNAGTSSVVWRDHTGEVSLMAVVPPPAWVGTPVDHLASRAGGRATAITRFGECRLPTSATLIQAEDLVHLALAAENVDQLELVLAQGPTDD